MLVHAGVRPQGEVAAALVGHAVQLALVLRRVGRQPEDHIARLQVLPGVVHEARIRRCGCDQRDGQNCDG